MPSSVRLSPRRSAWVAAPAVRPASGRPPPPRSSSRSNPRRGRRVNSTPLFPGDGIRHAAEIAAPTDPILIGLLKSWEAKRDGRRMPSRADIDPAELRSLVQHVMLYDVVEPGSLYRIRLEGQAI